METIVESKIMIMQIIVGAIALAFIVLVVFLIRTLVSLRKTLKKVDRVLQDAHKSLEPVSELIHNASKLTADIRKKSEGFDPSSALCNEKRIFA